MESKLFKKLFSMMLVVAMVLSMCPSIVFAESADSDGNKCPECTGEISWDETWTGSEINGSGHVHYRLKADVTVSANITVESGLDLVIDLAGYSIRSAGSNRCFLISNGGSLTVIDSKRVDNGQTVDGQIVGASSCKAAGANINVESGGVFKLYDGQITGGTTVTNGSTKYHGGNIYTKGTVYLYGGEVKDGVASNNGGNVCAYGGRVYIYDGVKIHNGKSSGNGGNVYCGTTGALTIYGGEIYGSLSAMNVCLLNNTTGTNHYMYGGVIGKDTDAKPEMRVYGTAGKYISNFYMYGGTVRSIYVSGGAANEVKLYNGVLGEDPSVAGYSSASILADCACYVANDDGTYTIWNYKHAEGIECADCKYEAALSSTDGSYITQQEGNHQGTVVDGVTTCDNCGASIECAHAETKKEDATPATCLEAGNTGDTICTACGAVTVAGDVIEKLPHSYDAEGNCTNGCEDIAAASVTLGEDTTYYSTALEALQAASGTGANVCFLKTTTVKMTSYFKEVALKDVTLSTAPGVTFKDNSGTSSGTWYINNVTFAADSTFDLNGYIYISGGTTVNIYGHVTTYMFNSSTGTLNIYGDQGGYMRNTGNFFCSSSATKYGGKVNIYGDPESTEPVFVANEDEDYYQIANYSGTFYIENAVISVGAIVLSNETDNSTVAPSITAVNSKIIARNVKGTSTTTGNNSMNVRADAGGVILNNSILELAGTLAVSDDAAVTLIGTSTITTTTADLQNSKIVVAEGFDGCVWYENGAYAAKAHDADDATCTADGKCSNCTAVVNEATGHEHPLTAVDQVDATCTASGLKAYSYCSVCNAYYVDENGTQIADFAAWQTGDGLIAALGHKDGDDKDHICDHEGCDVVASEHSYTASVTDPTCTAAGYTTYTCACGDTYTEAGEAATGHNYTYTSNGDGTHNGVCANDASHVVTNEACDEAGADGACSKCGYVAKTYVAEVNGTQYESLADAENAAVDGDTITLLADIELTQYVTFYDKAGARMVTLDMNGKTITLTERGYAALWVCDGLTITGNGKIIADPAGEAPDEGASAYAIMVGSRGTAGNLVVENGTFYSDDSSVISVTHGSATIKGGSFESEGKDLTLNCIDDMYDAGKAAIIVEGGEFKGFNPFKNAAEGTNTNFAAPGLHFADMDGDGIYTKHEAAYVAKDFEATFEADAYTVYTCVCGDTYTVTHEGTKKTAVAEVNGTQYESLLEAWQNATANSTIKLLADVDMTGVEGMYVPSSTLTLDLNGFTLKVPFQAIAFAGDNFTICNGTIDSLGASYGLWIGGYADAAAASNVTIEDVTVIGGINIKNATNVTLNNVTATGIGYYAVWVESNASGVVINSGSYTGAEGKAAVSAANADALTVKGGTYSSNVTAFCEEGKHTAPAEGVYVYGEHSYTENVVAPDFGVEGYTEHTCACGDSYKDTFVAAKVAVAEANGTKYETLEEAIAAGGEVKLLANIEIKTSIKVTNTVSVDLNGYTLTGPDDGKANWYAFIVDGGDLTLKGEGQLYAKCYGVETKSGSFTLDGATIVATKNKTVGTAIVNYGGTVIIKSGYASGANDAVYTGGYFSNASTTILGGTIEGTVTVENWEAKDFTEAVSAANNSYTPGEDQKWVEQDGVYVLTDKVYVAEADGVGYETLEEAVAAGGEVKLLANIEIKTSIKVTNTVSVDLNGYTLTGPDDGKANWYAFIVDGGDLTLKGEGQLYAKCYGVETKSGSFTLDGATIVATKNKTVGTAIVNYGGTVIIKSGYASGANDVVYTGGYFSNASTTILGGTIEGTVTVENWEAKDFTEAVSAANNSYTPGEDQKWVEQDGVYVLTDKVYVAEVDGVKYETFAEAFAQGGEIKLLADITLTEQLTIRGLLTIDLNGFNITGNVEGAYGMIYVAPNSNLGIKGEGTVKNDGGYAIGNYGFVVIHEGVTVEGADAALYNFYYNAQTYGSARIAGKLNVIWNCGTLNVEDTAEVAYLDNSGYAMITGTVTELYAQDGSDCPALENAGTLKIADTSKVTLDEGFILWEVEEGVYKVHAHEYTESYTEPTTEKDGFWTYTCVCGDSYTKIDENTRLHVNVPTVDAEDIKDNIETEDTEATTEDIQDVIDHVVHGNEAVINKDIFVDAANDAVIEQMKQDKPELADKEPVLHITLQGMGVKTEAGVLVAHKLVFDVTPMLGDTKIENLQKELTFHLPVDDSLSGNAYVYHEGEFMGIYEIVTENGHNYVIVSSKNFSEFTVEVQNENDVAVNMTTGETYTSVQAALNAAAKGDTVKLLKDATEEEVFIGSQKTLDLNGYTLTADSVNASFGTSHIIDSTNGNGLLAVDKANIALNSTNKQLPLWSDEGARFVDVNFGEALSFVDKTGAANANVAYFRFAFNDKAAKTILDDYLANGSEGTCISIRIKATYTTASGTVTQYFDIPSSLVEQYINSGNGWDANMFKLYLTGVEGKDIHLTAQIVSTANAEAVVVIESDTLS